MEKIKINSDFIKLDQFLKFVGISDSGAEAKILIKNGGVTVNGIEENKRGKKLRKGDLVKVKEKEFIIEN